MLLGVLSTELEIQLESNVPKALSFQIEAGELVPDRAIPSESTLMQRYGVARETARKAVRVLVAEGLVYVVQGRGAYVAQHG